MKLVEVEKEGRLMYKLKFRKIVLQERFLKEEELKA